MSSLSSPARQKRPLIGCTTYRKTADQNPPIDLFGLMPTYLEAIVAAGGIPIMIPLGLSDQDLQLIFERVDGLLLPGGGDVDPEFYHGQAHVSLWGIDRDRDRVEFFLARAAVTRPKPLLAICRGHQVFNVALGGTLWVDVSSQMPNAIKHDHFGVHPRNYVAHDVKLQPDSKLSLCLGRDQTDVNSLHHQGIRDLAPELTAVAVAPDGLIEAVEVVGHPFAVGVQWHPENLIHDDPAMLALFEGLVTASNQ